MKKAFVVGASRGIGKALVDNLASRGYIVFAGSRNPSVTDTSKVTEIYIDVTDDKSITQAYKSIAAQTSHIDLLINCAGINPDTTGANKEATTRFGKLRRDELSEMFQINTFAPVLVTQKFAPLLDNSKVVNISSYRASLSHRVEDQNYNNYGYASSKVALNMLTHDLSHDLAERNTAVFAINPGSVRTDMNKRGKLSPAEAADKLLQTVDKLGMKDSGGFYDNNGRPFPL